MADTNGLRRSKWNETNELRSSSERLMKSSEQGRCSRGKSKLDGLPASNNYEKCCCDICSQSSADHVSFFTTHELG